MNQLTHLNAAGEAHMVDVGTKENSQRSATAEAYISMLPLTLTLLASGSLKKGDVFSAARIAGIQAAKKCSDLIPLCHPLMITGIDVELIVEANKNRVRIQATCKLNGQTGIEMEALTAVSVSALTIYDMCKAVDKGMIIEGIKLLKKSGGKSGNWPPTANQKENTK